MGTIGLSQAYVDAVNRLYTQAAGGRAAATLDIVYVADAQADEVMGPLRAMAQAEGFRSLIVVPFIRGGEAIGALANWYQEGKLKYRVHVIDGLKNAPTAMNMLFDGSNQGKLIIRI